MKRYEIIVIGAGPAGLSAACAAAEAGIKVVVFDENERPGGQLFKQIHKFFGSREHQAGIRGTKIGENLLARALSLKVKVVLGATVLGIYKNREVSVRLQGKVQNYKADALIIATGASENMVSFEGWTKPGVMGAGAAQTLMNLHGVRPGKRVLMLGSGNVGLVVSFQLMQAGCEVVAIVDAAARIGGYGVHAAKLARMGVPFYTSHTVIRAVGEEVVQAAVIAAVDESFTPLAGSEKTIEVDTICSAVGLSPMSQLADNAGCEMVFDAAKGGFVPVLDEVGQTSQPGIYCAGDVCGIEEASSAMIQGKLAANAAACQLGYLSGDRFAEVQKESQASLAQIRAGMFGPGKKGRSDIQATDEGCPLSQSLLTKGYLAEEELSDFPATTWGGKTRVVLECTQNIPCDPCQDICPRGCIKVGSDITALPLLVPEQECTGCGLCVGVCSGQAIFLINDAYDKTGGTVGLPYEFYPLPAKGDVGWALDRSGTEIGEAVVVDVRSPKALDKTAMLVIRVAREDLGRARFFKAASTDRESGAAL